MANWGVPDFSDTVSEQEMQALHARILAETKGHGLVAWPHNDLVERGYNQSFVQIWCVKHEAWQRVRLSMKGVVTHRKLEILKLWWDKTYGQHVLNCGLDVCAIQVGNYLGALRRGGQLDDYNRVRRYI